MELTWQADANGNSILASGFQPGLVEEEKYDAPTKLFNHTPFHPTNKTKQQESQDNIYYMMGNLSVRAR